MWEGDFPRYVWAWINVVSGTKEVPLLVEARLSNHLQGTYHGYPIGTDDLTGKKTWTRQRLLREDGVWRRPLT
jgi:hypothetical protein